MQDVLHEIITKDPASAELVKEFLMMQEEYTRLLDLMGVRHVAIEVPPANNSEGTLRGSVSGVNR